jgi:telomere length regulation protein
VQYLVGQFYSSNHSLGTKLEILDILRMSAEKLADMSDHGPAAPKPLVEEVARSSSLVPVNAPAYSSSSHPSAVSETLAHHQKIIAERVEKRTKRWGATKRAAEGTAVQQKTYSVNRFTPVAHLFFYPLMKQIDQPAAVVYLHQHDSLLLIRLLHTVSAFLPCSSGLAQSLPLATRGMAKVLMEYLLMHASRGMGSRTVGSTAEIGIRRIVFYALSRILVTYNEALFADDFPQEMNELVAWLTEAAQMDKDPECRQMATANLHLLKSLVAIGNPFESLFRAESNNVASIAGAQLPALKF